MLLALVSLPASGQESESSDKWIQLFNGKDLDDWQVKIRGYELDDNFGNTFRVEDGLLKVRYDAYDKFDARFGHIFY
ncbi:MAG: family 16 glycoside hydrolase, partial [Maioricimonas sp. JB049]